MTDSIAHRGPDGEGLWISPAYNVCFGHRRLSIIDLSDSAAQPMNDASGRYSITFNGEIYNYLELRNELIQDGVSFRSDSDTEVLLALYIKYGATCLNKLDGMFAFAIYDSVSGEMFAARDRFGEKPFYYFANSSTVIFASEMKALFASGVPRQYDPRRLHFYLAYNLYLDPNDASSTFFKDVKQLAPGQYMKVNSDGQITFNKYWSVNTETHSEISFEDAIEQFRFLLKRSVQRRLRSDVPVGSSLSGGLDSSTLVLLIEQLKAPGQIQKTFSARFRNFSKDEGEFIKAVLDAAPDIAGFEVWPDHSVLDDIQRIMYHQEEPFGSASIVAQWSVMKLAKQNNVTVLLDGQGADEILGGYRTFFEPTMNALYASRSTSYAAEKQLFTEFLGYNYQPSFNTRMMLRYPRIFRAGSGLKGAIAGKRKISPLNPGYTQQFENTFGSEVSPYTGEYNTNVKTLQSRIIERGGFVPLLRYADRNAMAHSREVRLPFLDHELVDFCISLPDNFKVGGGWTKRLLRESYSGLLPEKICRRRDKVGFEAPQKDWMNNPEIKELAAHSNELLLRERILNKGHKVDSWHLIMAANLIQ